MNDLELIPGVMPEGTTILPASEILRGQGSWLFDQSSSTSVIDQITGNLLLSPKALRRWQFVLESRQAWLRRHGSHYVVAVAPTAHVVMREKLPDKLLLSAERPITQLLDHLEAARSSIDCAYLLEPLLREKESGRDPFQTHDSQWNGNGAFVAYQTLMQAMSRDMEVGRYLRRDDIGFAWCPAPGDLELGVDPNEDPRRALIGRPHPRSARLVQDTRLAMDGRVITTECDLAPSTTGMMFGGKASYRMLPYLSESFRRFVFAHLPTLDHELVEAEKPDVVITLIDEPSLINVPADIEAPTAHELTDRKLATQDALLPELAPLWGEVAAGSS